MSVKSSLNALKNVLIAAVLCLHGLFLFGQNSMHGIEVRGIDETFLKYPWAGGMNSVQFGEIDLNLDGLHDLFVFDRNGNRKMCFINNGIYNTVDYTFSPEYAELLPDLYDWAIFADYNGDGKSDIFTYSPGWAGIQVYKNVSDNMLKFERVVYPYLKTFQENGYVNLLVTNVDYPGIADIDHDGDLDILTFWGLGSFVNYQRNMSMELYGNADSLTYVLEEYCWGRFAENDESNALYFDTCFTERVENPLLIKGERHTGSSLLLLDLDKDTVMDLLLGDIDYPNIFALNNDGTKKHAFIGSADTAYPSVQNKINMYSLPAAAFIDVNNDLKKDLLVSPFTPGLEAAENKRSVLYYKNTGANDKPFFNYVTKSFLQDEMIDQGSGAYPVLYDWNKDGLMDLMVGNYGFYQYAYYDEFYNLHAVYESRIGYFQNTGTETSPRFQLLDADVAGLSFLKTTGLIPTFDDLDKDGLTDILCGSENGKLILVMNRGNKVFDVVSDNFSGIDVGEFSAPQLFDLNKDGLLDLIIGEKAGNLNYYQNTGSPASPVFEYVTDSLGKINVTNYNISWDGYSVPCFFRFEDGVTRLVVGSEQGKIFYYTDIDNNLSGAWTLSDLNGYLNTSGLSFDEGIRTAAAVGDLFKDGKPEMIKGNYSGGMEYINGSADVSQGINNGQSSKYNAIQIFPNPAKDHITFLRTTNQSEIQIEIRSISGTKLSETNLNVGNEQSISLGVGQLSAGIYILIVRDDKSIRAGKFSISR